MPVAAQPFLVLYREKPKTRQKGDFNKILDAKNRRRMQMEWTKLKKTFKTKEAAKRAAMVVETTESRLSGYPYDFMYEIETKVIEVDGKWLVLWRRIPADYGCPCEECGGCEPEPQKEFKAQVLPFRRPKDK